MQSVFNAAQIGDPIYDGLTLGGQLDVATFVKADWPGVRAIRTPDGVIRLVDTLPDSYPVPSTAAGSGYAPGDPVYFTTAGGATFTKGDYPSAVAFLVECQGGGGGGGGGAATGAGAGAVGSGGAGGCYARSVVPAADLDATEAVTVGNGGTGGATGSNAGTTGGASVVDTIPGEVRGAGGEGGNPSGTAAASGSASPGIGTTTGSTGQLRIAGGDGWSSGWRSAGVDLWAMGAGGGAHLAASGRVGSSNAGSAGINGKSYGGGGGGGYNYPSQGTARPGGDGASGIVIITPYFGAGSHLALLELLY